MKYIIQFYCIATNLLLTSCVLYYKYQPYELNLNLYVTGFTKIDHTVTRTETQIMP